MSFLGNDGRAALTQAIADFEAKTAAELVISVRPRSSRYLHLNIELGLLGGTLCLAYLLYGDPAFDLHWFLVLPLALGLFLGVAASTPALQRLLVGPDLRRAAVLQAARAAFVERGVAETSGRTGLLLYISIAEREFVLIPDTGLRRALPEVALAEASERLRVALAGGRALALVPAILGLGDLCGEHLPRAHDDIDELPNEVHT